MKKIRKHMMKAALLLVGLVLQMDQKEAQQEFALTWAEMKMEGQAGPVEEAPILNLTIEFLNRYAKETRRAEMLPEHYMEALDNQPLFLLAEMAQNASLSIHNLANAFSGARDVVNQMGRAIKDLDISDNPEDYI